MTPASGAVECAGRWDLVAAVSHGGITSWDEQIMTGNILLEDLGTAGDAARAKNDTNRKSVIDGCTIRHASYQNWPTEALTDRRDLRLAKVGGPAQAAPSRHRNG